MTRLLLVATAALALAACRQDATAGKPPPAKMTADALGHYCQMLVADHAGPKSQIFLKGDPHPLWFGQVTDAIAYLHDPERDGEVVAFYVTDTAHAESWAVPGDKAWTDGQTAVYVLDSSRKGGMGMPEAIPFAARADAEAYVKEAGGRIVALAEVPESYVRPIIGNGAAMPAMKDMPGMAAGSAGAGGKETN